MQYGPKRTSHFSMIWLNKSNNEKRTSKSLLNSVFSYSKLRRLACLTYFPRFVVFCLEIVENIDQMHKSNFSYYKSIETSLMTSLI